MSASLPRFVPLVDGAEYPASPAACRGVGPATAYQVAPAAAATTATPVPTIRLRREGAAVPPDAVPSDAVPSDAGRVGPPGGSVKPPMTCVTWLPSSWPPPAGPKP